MGTKHDEDAGLLYVISAHGIRWNPRAQAEGRHAAQPALCALLEEHRKAYPSWAQKVGFAILPFEPLEVTEAQLEELRADSRFARLVADGLVTIVDDIELVGTATTQLQDKMRRVDGGRRHVRLTDPAEIKHVRGW